MKIRITLTRSPALIQYGPVEEEVLLGVFNSVQLTYDLLRTEGEDTGIYDDEKSGWVLWSFEHIPKTLHHTVWSHINLQPVE